MEGKREEVVIPGGTLRKAGITGSIIVESEFNLFFPCSFALGVKSLSLVVPLDLTRYHCFNEKSQTTWCHPLMSAD